MIFSRRSILALGGAAVGLGAFAGGSHFFWPRPKLAFETVSHLTGFRRIVTPNAGISAFISGVEMAENAPLTQDQLCRITFDDQEGAGKLVIASFSDFFCPYCRVLDQQVHKIAAADPQITLISHQVPLLGRASDFAARGGIVAQKAGVYEDYFNRLIRTTFVPNPAYLRDFAAGQGLDPDGFIADLNSPETEAKLAQSLAAFRAFGFVGTPGLVVGRTLVNGVISSRDLRALCVDELANTASLSCG